MEDKFEISVTPRQAEAISKACEFYARVVNGQFYEIAYECGFNQVPMTHSTEAYHAAIDLLYQARALLFPELGVSQGTHYGVGKNDRSDIAWDIHAILRHELWKLKAAHTPITHGYSVDSHYPVMQWGSEPPCVVCHSVTNCK